MDKIEVSNEVKNEKKSDLIASVVIFILGLFVFINALKMPITSITGSADKWYIAPGIFPIFIGITIMILSTILFFSSKKDAGRFKKEELANVITFLKGETSRRFFIALALLAIYVFVLLGHIKYEISTFLYVFSNVFIFREKKFAIWKIIIFSLICSVVVGYSFSHFARIPLP